MQGKSKHIWLNCLILLAFISVGISPACKFISGQASFVEICGVDGIKTVRLAADELPPEPVHHDKASSECGFCIASAHIKTAPAKTASIVIPATSHITLERFALATYADDALRSVIFPRGPPTAV